MLLEDRSRFGTYLNGELIGKGGSAPVRDGDRLSLVAAEPPAGMHYQVHISDDHAFRRLLIASEPEGEPQAHEQGSAAKTASSGGASGLLGGGLPPRLGVMPDTPDSRKKPPMPPLTLRNCSQESASSFDELSYGSGCGSGCALSRDALSHANLGAGISWPGVRRMGSAASVASTEAPTVWDGGGGATRRDAINGSPSTPSCSQYVLSSTPPTTRGTTPHGGTPHGQRRDSPSHRAAAAAAAACRPHARVVLGIRHTAAPAPTAGSAADADGSAQRRSPRGVPATCTARRPAAGLRVGRAGQHCAATRRRRLDAAHRRQQQGASPPATATARAAAATAGLRRRWARRVRGRGMLLGGPGLAGGGGGD